MNRIMTFDTYEDEPYRQMVEQYSTKNLETIKRAYEIEQRLRLNPADTETKQNPGSDLDLICLIELGVSCKRYYYECPLDMLPEGKSDDYRSILGLAKELQKTLHGAKYYGIGMNPLFYTTPPKERPFLSDMQKQDVIEGLEEHCKEHNKNMSFMGRIIALYAIWRISASKDTERGLTEKEREEFERLYWKEK